MDFNEEFALLQGTLLSLEKAVGDLKLLTLHKGDEAKITMVVDAIKRFICGIGIKPDCKSLDARQTQTLRRTLMFLMLNTNLDIKDKLMDDINCGHIVDCAPNLNKELLLELVDKLSLCNLMCEAIIYIPLSLGVELVDSLMNKLNTLQPFEALPWIENLARAIYTKYLILQTSQKASSKCGQSKLFTYFKKLLQYFISPDLKSLSVGDVKKLYGYAGFAIKSILLLLIDCVKLNLNPKEQLLDAPEVYDISLPEYYDKNERQTVSSISFIAELLSTCKVNCQSITVDIWLFWLECDVEITENVTKSLQSVIAEAMYDICELLAKSNDIKSEVPVAEDIITMFSNMAVKPRDEDDEIQEADVKLIIKNVLDNTKSQKKWFKALIERDIMTNEECINCLENCSELADFEGVKIIIEKSTLVLGSNSSDEYHNRIRSIGLDMVKRLPLDQQVDIVQWYFEKFGINTMLMKDNFQGVITEVFNKAVKTSRNKDKFVSECVILCLQSPVDAIAKIMHEALTNNKQISLMLNILKNLKYMCNVHYSEEEKPPTLTLVTYLLDRIMHKNLTDVEKSNFVKFVSVLTNHNILNGSVFVRNCLIPALHRSTCTTSWSLVQLWLQTLQAFIKGTVNVAIDIPYCPVLVMLAQVVEKSRWNLLTYSAMVASVCDEALVVIKIMLASFLDKKNEEDKEVRWLQSKLEDLSALNKRYFCELWSKFGRDWTSLPYNMDLFLLDIIQSDKFIEENKVKVIQMFEHMESKENALIFSLTKLLPLCTVSEWTVLADTVKQIDKISSDLLCIHMFSESVLLLMCVMKKEALLENDSVLLCLDYCVRNLALVMKEKIIPEMMCSEEKVKVFIKMVHVLGNLPPACKESCSILIINVLVELMQGMFDNEITYEKRLCYIKDMATNTGVLNDSELRQALARKMMDCLALQD